MSTAPLPDTEAEPTVEPADAIRLVLGVARLGEADLAGWWSSQGLNPAVRFTRWPPSAGRRSTPPWNCWPS